jgi:RIO kinase 2
LSARYAAVTFRSLSSQDFRVLRAVEFGMVMHEFVPIQKIAQYANLPGSLVSSRLDYLAARKLVRHASSSEIGYTGYNLTYAGYDCLALNALVRKGVIEAVGKVLGIGKEADVFEALTPSGRRVAAKFHRLGRISFRQTKKKRGYIAQRSHASWLYQSRLAAQREIKALRIAWRHRVAVPEPIAQNRHVVISAILNGMELSKYYELSKPDQLLRRILRNLRVLYCEAGIVHGDISEYNILLSPSGRMQIIDWPQYVSRRHPASDRLITRDVANIVNFFQRRFGSQILVNDALNYVSGRKERLQSSRF